MTYERPAKIIAFIGLPGAGKSTATEYLTEKGYPKVYAGAIFYKAMEAAGIKRTQQNENEFRATMKLDKDSDVFITEYIKQIHDLIDAGQHSVVTDGLISWGQYKQLKQEFPGEFSVVAIVAPKHARHHRLNIRPDRPLTDTEANDRDWHEIEDAQVGGPIAIADHYIINDSTIEKLHQDIDAVISELDF